MKRVPQYTLLGLVLLSGFPVQSFAVSTDLTGTSPVLWSTIAIASLHSRSAFDSLTSNLATITTDTGTFAPGHRDFSRYTTVELCRAAVAVTARVSRGTIVGQADSLRHRAEHDTLGASAVAAVARVCSARFPLTDRTSLSDMSALLYLALRAQDLPQAQIIVTRATAMASPAASDIRLQAIATSLDSIVPANVPAATTFLAQLDARGPSAMASRIAARQLFVNFWARQDDTLHLHQAATQLLALADSTTSAALGASGYDVVANTYRHLLRLTWWSAPDSVAVVAHRACQDLNRIRRTWSYDCSHPTAADYTTVLNALLPQALEFGVMKRPAPPLHADFWFPVIAGDTMIPRPGGVTLVVHGLFTSDHNIADPEHAWWEWDDRHQTEHLRHWLAVFGPPGLRATVVAATHGYALFRGILSPESEAQVIRQFVQETEHLPVTVAVRTTPARFLPSPDGRRVQVSDETLYGSNQKYFGSHGYNNAPYVLIGRDGMLLLETNDPDLIEIALRKIFATQPQSALPR